MVVLSEKEKATFHFQLGGIWIKGYGGWVWNMCGYVLSQFPTPYPLFLILLEQVLRGVINRLHAEVEKREEKRVIRLHVAYAQ